MTKQCIGCGTDIPAKRLEIVPNATMCVPCLEAAGDVAPLRRFDERGVDGETVSTFYVKNNYVESLQKRINSYTMPDNEASEEFQYEFFEKPVEHIGGYALSEAFEEEKETDEEPTN